MIAQQGPWRRSSYGNGNGNCVEVAPWRRSSYSGAGQTNCVEVAAGSDLVGVRDSKNIPGPILLVPTATWRQFLTNISS
jgi:hypothetical protein